MLPYEKDIENFYREDTSESNSADSPRFYKEPKQKEKRDSETFKMWVKHSCGTMTKQSSNPSANSGMLTDRRGSRFIDVLNLNPNFDQREKNKLSRNRKKRKSL